MNIRIIILLICFNLSAERIVLDSGDVVYSSSKKLSKEVKSLLEQFLPSDEKITNFDSDITVHQDGSMTVKEKITVLATNQKIKHGITREFPTNYKDNYGNNYVVQFDVKEVLKNGSPEPFTTSNFANGKIVKIGSKDIILKPGIYQYQISYKTNRQLLFDDNGKDELYWNVTGNGWRFPIEKASATVHLPFLPEDKKEFYVFGYTGYQSIKNQDFKYYVDSAGIHFYSTIPLLKNEGLTIGVRWPTGYVEKPTLSTKIYYFLHDNFYVIFLLFGLLAICVIYFLTWLKARKTKKPGVVIPRFYPPQNMLPSQVRFLKKMKFDDKSFATELVNMAVYGFFKIESARNLIKNEELPKDAPEEYYKINESIFLKDDLVKLVPENSAKINSIQTSVKLHIPPDYKYIITNEKPAWLCYGISLISIISTLIFTDLSPLIVGIIATSILINLIFTKLIKTYTPEGRALVDEIDGFKLFLKTTETDRLKIIGTPPDKTPQLYEKYLPYAMALDVEDQWSAQFVPIFEKLKSEGHPYVPIWYVGTPFSPRTFGRNISSNLGSAISSSKVAPGSSSGSGGRGSSGGGGGGGGGGGW